MTNEEMAASTFRAASCILDEARRYHREGVWGLAIRRSQEVVELCLKAVLRFIGLEVPKIHDVSGFLRRYKERLPAQVTENLDRVSSISRTLREEREISFYGDEEAGFTAEELYSEEDAKRAISDATFVFELCEQLIKTK